ncbi:AI-2E family transporter [Lacimicrobium alkaliphilum]|uniref:AI-2E family transporter n=1 Tax=Lacimicrobium alkaliphilum TaxID=1526571 RepID=A0ABQ1R0J5_9ALTE|nr:AI-2E family transporter [Lacimicrobium alkaliphilum]GGD52134.1 AI-2E family transporter [Lacimicrobium alkaliphilum]
MLEVFSNWYKQKFSDPASVALLLFLLATFAVFVFWGEMLAPVLVAIVVAYLLEWPVSKLVRTGLGRTWATTLILILFTGLSALALVGLLPVVWRQAINLLIELPQIWSEAQIWLSSLPDKYPGFLVQSDINNALKGVNERVVGLGEDIISASFSSIVSIVALLIYLILVPLMVFFMLKDKHELLTNISNIMPRDRRLVKQVSLEMNSQIINYIRGKVLEILIVGTMSTITFALMDLRYSLLLGVLVGFSVLIPYIGAAVVTFPVAAVALFQWGVTPPFWYLMVAYGIIQALDGNLIVPILFSEAVSLHPVYIIIAVLFFGGLWGFWGVFFAIPLATLVKALLNAWSGSNESIQSQEPAKLTEQV